jgi:DNA polymerase-3 subunit beta
MLPDKGEVRIGLSESKVSFRFDDVTLVSKLIDGTFPDYMRVVPTANPNKFMVDREQLFAAIDRVTTLSGSGRAVKFSFADGEVTLATNDPDAGSAEETVPVDCLSGDAVEVGFNGRYCLDLLSAAATENVIFELGDAGSPARVLPNGADDTSPWFVIMPMRV